MVFSILKQVEQTHHIKALVADAWIPKEDGKDYLIFKNGDVTNPSLYNLLRLTKQEYGGGFRR